MKPLWMGLLCTVGVLALLSPQKGCATSTQTTESTESEVSSTEERPPVSAREPQIAVGMIDPKTE